MRSAKCSSSSAKGLALRLGIPIVYINHLEAHLYSAFLDPQGPTFEETCPFIALTVSGGHTCLVRVDGMGQYTLLGQTLDDAAGEAFDKGAMLLGLGYPGGPVIDRLAKEGDPTFVSFPVGTARSAPKSRSHLDPKLCFSFSGLKTALLYYVRDHSIDSEDEHFADLIASYQEAIVKALCKRCEIVANQGLPLVAVGGVSINGRLRAGLKQVAESAGVPLWLAQPKYCGDNAAMIAGLAGAGGGLRVDDPWDTDVLPSLKVG